MSDSDADSSQSITASQFQALLSAAVDAIVVIDGTGLIRTFNGAAERLFGYTAAQTFGKDVGMLMPDPPRQGHGGYLQAYQRTGKASIIGVGREVEALRRDGTLVPVWLSVGEAKTEDGVFFVGILRDLSAQHAARERHAELEARLAHVARFNLMGEMAGGIAHEINQPLSAITTYAQAGRRLIEADDFSTEELHTICSRISEQTLRAAEVIQNLRAFFRKQEREPTAVDVDEAINDIAEFIRLDARGRRIAVHVNLAGNLPKISGNDIQIQQIVLNLTRNAVDAMANSRESARRQGIILTTRLSSSGSVCIIVEDHGPGVARGLSDAVFHPFVSTKSDGLGVGLAITKTIVESHGGSIAYRSAAHGGAVFEATFPVEADGSKTTDD